MLAYTLALYGISSESTGKVPCVSEKNHSKNFFSFHVAPMQCYTNAPLRQLYRELWKDAILWTEMEKVQDLLSASDDALERRFGPPGFQDYVLQLGGSDVTMLKECIRRLHRKGYRFREINLNCGCPSIEVGGSSNFGASLMKDERLTRNLLLSMKEAVSLDMLQSDISIKCRIAVLNSVQEMSVSSKYLEGFHYKYSDNQYIRLANYLSQAQQAGASHFILHARAVILSGLSPEKNRIVPPLNYDFVQRIANDFPNTRVTLNGGIATLSDLTKACHKQSENSAHLTDDNSIVSGGKVNSFMSGRWMLRRPLDLLAIEKSILSFALDDESNVSQRCASPVIALENYAGYVNNILRRMKGNASGGCPSIADLCLPLFLVSEQLRDDSERLLYDRVEGENNTLLNEDDIEHAFALLIQTLASIQENARITSHKILSFEQPSFRKLSSSFKSIVGTKVANKWKRNRQELSPTV